MIACTDPVTCHQCNKDFDPTDESWDGRARYRDTPWCRSCVDRCHDSEMADHRCRICSSERLPYSLPVTTGCNCYQCQDRR